MRLNADEITEAVAWRHHLHAHPELSLHEHATSDFIAGKLTEWGLNPRRGLGKTGVVASLSKGTSGRAIAIRADIDALPIIEATGASYQSLSPGVMHACGHDGHTATLLAAARRARELPFDGTVHFIFQPAEESEGGARLMIEDGLFDAIACDQVYALHNWPGLPVGQCVAREGAMMAAFAVFEIVLTGRGAHAAMPHEGIDPIPAAAALTSALQTVASRTISPLEPVALTVTQVHAGDAWNVIPESAVLRGTARWFADAVGDAMEQRLREIVAGVAAAHGCTASIDYQRRYPATLNTPAEARHLLTVAAGVGLQPVEAPPSMASEDFAFMLREKPGAYLWLGAARAGENPGLHSPRFDFNDTVLADGAALWLGLIAASLAGDQT